MIKKQLTILPIQIAATELSALLKQYEGRDVLLLLAGGSSFQVYNFIDPEVLGTHVTLACTDDRYVHDLENNNFAHLQTTDFYHEATACDTWAISSEPLPGESFEEFRARFERGLHLWIRQFPEGVVIAVLGIGPDGHIAGIIPEVLSDEAFTREYNSAQLVGKMNAGTKNQFPERISITFSFMKKYITHALVFCTGEAKREALERVLASSGGTNALPAGVITELRDVILVTDQRV